MSKLVKNYKILINNEEWRYTGYWKLRKPHGFGTAESYHGDRFSGQWCEGVRHGKGKYTWADGSEYDGEWTDGEFDGYGIFKWVNGCVYDGNWMKGIKEGKGRYTWRNGDYYDGDWKDDKKHGNGSLIWNPKKSKWNEILHLETENYVDPSLKKRRNSYVGQWENEVPNGYGRITTLNCEIYGFFSNGVLNGFGEKKYADGTVYEGGFKDGFFHGYGVRVLIKSMKHKKKIVHKFEGFWENNLRHGHGINLFLDGSKFDGDWFYDKPVGEGFHFKPDGKVYHIHFDQGKVTGVTQIHNSQSEFSLSCLKLKTKPCYCIRRAIKYRKATTNSMFTSVDYPCVTCKLRNINLNQHKLRKNCENSAVYFVGNDHYRTQEGAPLSKFMK